ncbi:methyl-accepting chemotaxis protein [Xylophilus rhododendri]|nr:methyl-accepting chemotaxis protein [Xylophilus rhododendri]
MALKLAFSFAIIVLLTLILGVVSWLSLNRLGEQTDSIARNNLPSITLLNDYAQELNFFRRSEAQVLLELPPENRKIVLTAMADRDGNMAKIEQKYAPMVASPEEQQAFDKLRAAGQAYGASRKRILAVGRDLDSLNAGTVYYMNESRELFAGVNRALEALVAINRKQADEAAATAVSTQASGETTIIATLVICLALAAILATLLTRMTVNSLRLASEATNRMADGDLTVAVSAQGTDEIGQLLKSLENMRQRLANVVGEVRGNAEGVATASAQIAQGNDDLSGRTEQQASALEETAASMEELNSTVRQNADNAQQASQLASGTSTLAQQGGDVVGQVVQTMKGINESSQRISDIISVIDGIAFQTNILALNAAVEAARAGEQGRGFAVVASEVRSLAQRSADAAKQIKTLISTSVERVDQGTELVDKAGATMQNVVQSIRQVNDLVAEISAASREQSAGVQQVGEAVTNMDQVTQQNAALVEEAAAAAGSLRQQAEQLVQAVAYFRIGETGVGHAMRAAAPMPAPLPATKPVAAARPAAPAVQAAVRKPAAAAAPKPVAKALARPTAAAPAPARSPAPASAKATASESNDDWESF